MANRPSERRYARCFTGDAERRSTASPQGYYDAFKKQGYTVDERIFGNGVCLAVAPTATARSKTFITTCTLQAKGVQLVMMAPSATSAVPSETVKKLVDLAITRLP